MNERVMQFRIGMFVIVAGLVLTMMIVWFGESPSLLRDQVYLKVRYAEAPGVLEGVPVRKSGIRIGEVFAIAFDERPNQPDGVLVTLALERKYTTPRGVRPAADAVADRRRDDRHAAGDRARDPRDWASTPADAPVIEGEVAPTRPRPSPPHQGVREGRRHPQVDQRGRRRPRQDLQERREPRRLPDDLDQDRARTSPRPPRESISSSRPTRTTSSRPWPTSARSRRSSTRRSTRRPRTRSRRASTSSPRPRPGSTPASPSSSPLSRTWDRPVNHTPTTDIGQAVRRINLVAPTSSCSPASSATAGAAEHRRQLQKLLTQAELHDNLNTMAVAATQALVQLKTVLTSLRAFAEKVSRDPSAISRGILAR